MKNFFQLRESLLTEKTMELAGETFQNMEHCPGAVAAFKKNLKDGASKEDVVKAARAVDAYLAIEDKAKKSGATDADIAKMKDLIGKAKSVISAAGLEGHTYHDMHLDRVKDMVNEAVQSADKKPEKYVGPDGKTKVRMVPVDRKVVGEKTLTPAEKKKREEIAQAIARDNPDMPMDKKMAIATAQAKKVAEAKDPNEYDNEGDMAKTQLRAIIKDAEHMIEMFADDENLPEWVQKKIIKAQDYLNSAHTYMMNNGDDEENMNEQYVKTTPGHLVKTADRIGAKFDSKKQAYFKNGVKIGHVQTASGPGTAGLSSRAKETFYIHKKLKEETVAEAMTASQHRMAMIDKIKKSGAVKSGSMSQNEAAPKMKGDSFKQERDRARAHDAAMGRTATGRKKPTRPMTSTQRSLAQLQRPSKK